MALSAAEPWPARVAVFLDRDGVINRRVPGDYVRTASELELLPGALDAMAALRAAGAALFVVTNQRGVARGLVREAALAEIHGRLRAAAREAGADIEAIYVCPHEIDTCECRKPKVGLFIQARAAHAWIDFRRAHLVGDSLADLEAGARLGMSLWLAADDHDAVRAAAMDLGIELSDSAASLAELALGSGRLLQALLRRPLTVER